MTPQSVSAIPQFDFYRCIGTSGCGRIVTGPEMVAGLSSGCPCPCGGLKFSPINLPWYGWFIPRVWRFAIQRLRGLA